MQGDWEFASAADTLFDAAGIADLYTNSVKNTQEQFLTVDVARFGSDRIVLEKLGVKSYSASGANGTVNIQLIEPGTMYGRRQRQLDVRISKRLRLCKIHWSLLTKSSRKDSNYICSTVLPVMEELVKVRRVIAKRLDGAPHETLLVIHQVQAVQHAQGSADIALPNPRRFFAALVLKSLLKVLDDVLLVQAR